MLFIKSRSFPLLACQEFPHLFDFAVCKTRHSGTHQSAIHAASHSRILARFQGSTVAGEGLRALSSGFSLKILPSTSAIHLPSAEARLLGHAPSHGQGTKLRHQHGPLSPSLIQSFIWEAPSP